MKNLSLIILSSFFSLALSACSQALTGKAYQESEHLPRVDEVKTLADMTSAAFEWDSKGSESIDGFHIYRGVEGEPEMKVVATIKDKYATHFVDTDLEPNTTYNYMVKTYTDKGYISANGALIGIRTSDRIAPLPFAQSITALPNRIKLIWRPHPDARVSAYVIERAKENGEFKTLAEVKNRLSAEYIDDGLKPNQKFSYRIRAKSADGVLSQPSEVLEATTRALPPRVEFVLASMKSPRKITVSWEKVEFAEFSHYRVYSSSSKYLPFTLLAKVRGTKYDDIINEPGQTRYYKVSAVDRDGLEGEKTETAVLGKTLEAPKAPKITEATSSTSGIFLAWQGGDERAVKFIVKRYGGSGDMVFREIKSTQYTDSSALSGTKYSYEVLAVDAYDIESKPSEKVNLSR